MTQTTDCTLATETKWGLGLAGAGLLGCAFMFPSMSGLFAKGAGLILIGIIIWYIWCKFTGFFCRIPLIGDMFCGPFRGGMRSGGARQASGRMTAGPRPPLRTPDTSLYDL